MTLAFVFPGQGSQSVGMLQSLAAAQPVVKSTFDEASAALGYDLWDLVQNGPEERLNATECTQPAMLAAGVATWRAWQEKGGPAPAFVAGHSLGEFTALVCSGALGFAEAAALVAFRGRTMQEAVPTGVGAMAAILGLDDADVEKACREAAQGEVVEPVNFNAPAQVVIAGNAAAVQRAMETAKGLGAKRAVPLPISVPSHSSLMLKAADAFGARVAALEVRAPGITYISAVDAQPHSDPADIQALLSRQLARPVRWTDTIRALIAAGATQIVECGPGKVLTGLNRRIERRPDLLCAALEDPSTLDAALTAVKGA